MYNTALQGAQQASINGPTDRGSSQPGSAQDMYNTALQAQPAQSSSQNSGDAGGANPGPPQNPGDLGGAQPGLPQNGVSFFGLGGSLLVPAVQRPGSFDFSLGNGWSLHVSGVQGFTGGV